MYMWLYEHYVHIVIQVHNVWVYVCLPSRRTDMHVKHAQVHVTMQKALNKWYFLSIKSGDSGGGSSTSLCFFSHKIFASIWGMLWVIVLHQAMTIGVDTLQEGEQSLLYNADVQNCVHYTIKNAYSCTSPPTYSSPYMNLDQMFCPNI